MRRLLAVLVAALTLTVLTAGPSIGAEGDDDPGLGERLAECAKKGPIGGAKCAAQGATGAASDALEGTPVGGIAEAANKLTRAAKKLSSFSPQGMVDEWAKNVGEFAIRTVGWISDRAVKITEPQFNQDRWLAQYAIAAGLGLILFAFVLVIVGARVAKSTRDRVDHVQLLRDAGLSLWLVPTAIIMGPAVLTSLGQALSGLGAVFSEQVREGNATERVVALVEPLVEEAGDWAPLGGAFGALLLFGVIGVLGVGVLVMLYFVSEMQLVFALLLPIVLAFWAHPPWRSMTRRVIAGLFALMLMPAVLQFVFWIVWTRVGTSDVSGVDAAIRLVVGLGILLAVPTLTTMLLPKFMPDGQGSPSASMSIGGGAIGGAMVGRMLMNQSRRTGTSSNRSGGVASPSQLPPGHTGPASTGGATKQAGATTGKRAAAGMGSKAATGAAGGSKAAAGAGAGKAASAGTAAGGPVGGAVVASAAAVAMGATALKKAGEGASSSSAGIADMGGQGGRQAGDR